MAPVSFDGACALIEAALDGGARRAILEGVSASNDFTHALRRLRVSMRSHAWKAGPHKIDLDEAVGKYDRRTRQEGFHALNDWDGKADHVNENIIPVDVLDYVIVKRGSEPTDATALAILLDYYFLHILSLFSLRIWDEGDPDANLDRLDNLLEMLQGPDGSGQRFVDAAATLILIATSHFEIVERGYGRLLARVRMLNAAHRVSIALAHAVSMGSHLRFGFEASYGRDTVVMRDDNVADYPWLCFALMTVTQEYASLVERGAGDEEQAPIVEGILNGLSADARAFVGQPPSVVVGQRRRSRGIPRPVCAASRCARRGLPALQAVARHLLAAVVLLQFLPQRAQRHGRRRAPAGTRVAADVRRHVDHLVTRCGRIDDEAGAGCDTDGLRPRQSRYHSRPSDAGHRVRPGDGPGRVCCYDAED